MFSYLNWSIALSRSKILAQTLLEALQSINLDKLWFLASNWAQATTFCPQTNLKRTTFEWNKTTTRTRSKAKTTTFYAFVASKSGLIRLNCLVVFNTLCIFFQTSTHYLELYHLKNSKNLNNDDYIATKHFFKSVLRSKKFRFCFYVVKTWLKLFFFGWVTFSVFWQINVSWVVLLTQFFAQDKNKFR